ncbi:translation machinery-associated protein 22 [Nadsonia fulvescens var. elongata DSM 6958]|uniref:Translation machinery-associated protein 22 n=1 Tax=Nadsonia fulvescens var. elongata DSM 6958 TaxID=857566 RepID=A0A1E3PMN9_9ASCO|nr:translation machinery-associated protein 22 [Nadsonia fulvescens var. elongata DSM 6958]
MTVKVVYCGICSFPPEYCEFGGAFKRCKEWLEKKEPELFQKLYSVEALEKATSSLSIEKQEEIERKIQKDQKKNEARAERELANKLSSKIYVKRIERNKRKHVIAISGLELCGIDMKKLAKVFASKFATGASVTKTADGKDEIVIQGDVGDEVETYIVDMLEEKGLDDVKVEQVAEKPKKKKPQV